MNKIKVGVIGTGNMGGAIIGGLLSSGSEVSAYDTDSEKLAALEKQGVRPAASGGELCQTCKYIILAVKPQVFGAVLSGIKDFVRAENVIISIAAGITEEYIGKQTIPNVRTVIVMPNTPFLLGKGATAMAKGTYTSEEEFEAAADIFRTGGSVEFVPMDKMKEIIAVNGSSPAFIYLYAKGFVDYAESVGIDREAALRLFAQSLIGSAAMMTDSGKSIDELIKMVSSPGGTTLAGLDALYEGNLTSIAADCCKRCTKRAYELEAKG